MQKTLFNLLILLGFMLFFGFWSIHLGQDVNWDLKNYHFYNAYAFLYNRMGWDIAPAMLQTYTNPFLDIFNYGIITTQKPIITSFILGSVSGISAFLLYQISLLLFEKNKFLSLLAVIIGTTGCAAIAQLGTTTNEDKIALFIILSVYFCIGAILNKFNPKKALLGAGLFAGIAVGFKLTAATYGLGICLGLIAQRKFTLNELILFVFTAVIGFVISDGFWLFKIYHLFQNPLFPYYNTVFHSPLAQNDNYSGSAFTPKSLLDGLLLPFYLLKNNHLTLEAEFRDFRLAIVFILGITAIIFKKPKLVNPAWRFLILIFISSYIIWLVQFTNYRYAIPLEYFAGLIIVYLITLITQKNMQIILSIFITLLILLTTRYPYWANRVKFGDNYFEITTPALPANSLVLLIYQPLAYTIPFFHAPTPIQFIGLDTNLTYPTYKTGLQKQISFALKTHQGPIFTLSYNQDKLRAQKDLSYYGRVLDATKCQEITPNTGDQLILCPIKP